MKVLVTGAAGFVGRNLVENLRNIRDGKNRTRPALSITEIYEYTRFYLFRSLDNVIRAAKGIGDGYEGWNSLYKNPDDGAYYLLIRKMDTDPEKFNRICNVLSEYSMPMDYSTGMDEFFREHMKVILSDNALQDLQKI